VVCRSEHAAAACRAATDRNPAFANVEWLNIGGARRRAPFNRIVVPAWLDRLAMRELAFNG
jgi:hypothetical protein